VIPCVTDVGRRLGVGGTPQAQSAHAPVAPPGSDAPQAAALVRLVGEVRAELFNIMRAVMSLGIGAGIAALGG
jgi:hypothetical protein